MDNKHQHACLVCNCLMVHSPEDRIPCNQFVEQLAASCLYGSKVILRFAPYTGWKPMVA